MFTARLTCALLHSQNPSSSRGQACRHRAVPCVSVLRIAKTNSLAPAGHLFNTFFSSQHQGQQQRAPSSDTSPHHSAEGSEEQSQAGTEDQQVIGSGRRQHSSGSREAGAVQQSEQQAGQAPQKQDEDGMNEQWAVQHQQGLLCWPTLPTCSRSVYATKTDVCLHVLA